MSLRINAIAPDFTAETTQGTIHFHDWIGDGWAVLFSHPKNFTPVCTTELGTMAGLAGEFAKRNAKIIGISVDPVASHASWMENFPWTRVPGVRYPDEAKPMIDTERFRLRDPRAAREMLGDGNFGGRYQRSDDEMLALWQVAVAETRELIEGPWS